MSDNVIALENREGPFQDMLARVLAMVPDNEREDRDLVRLLAFRLELDGEAAVIEYLVRHITDYIKQGSSGTLHDFIQQSMAG